MGRPARQAADWICSSWSSPLSGCSSATMTSTSAPPPPTASPPDTIQLRPGPCPCPQPHIPSRIANHGQCHSNRLFSTSRLCTMTDGPLLWARLTKSWVRGRLGNTQTQPQFSMPHEAYAACGPELFDRIDCTRQVVAVASRHVLVHWSLQRVELHTFLVCEKHSRLSWASSSLKTIFQEHLDSLRWCAGRMSNEVLGIDNETPPAR